MSKKHQASAGARTIWDSEAGRDAMANFDEQMWDFALQETEIGKRARLALRLRRDNANSREARQAIKPFMTAYVKLLATPADKLERDDSGAFTYPVILPKTSLKEAVNA